MTDAGHAKYQEEMPAPCPTPAPPAAEDSLTPELPSILLPLPGTFGDEFDYYILYSKSLNSTRTIVLPNVKAKQPDDRKVYYLAYVNAMNSLIRIGNAMNFIEACGSLAITGATNSLTQRFIHDSSDGANPVSKMRKKHSTNVVGIYTHNQKDSLALAIVFGANAPEVHSSGQYAHYNDANHKFHIWYGGKKQY